MESSGESDLKSLALKHVVSRDGYSVDTFCEICSEFFPNGAYQKHSTSVEHAEVKLILIETIYPYPCSSCHLRFSSLVGLGEHISLHKLSIYKNAIAITDHTKSEFIPHCCFVCWLPFPDSKHLKAHEKSIQHTIRMEMAMEVALRNLYVSDKLCEKSMVSGTNLSRNLSLRPVVQSKVASVTDVNVCQNTFAKHTCSTRVIDSGGVSEDRHKLVKPENNVNYYCPPCNTSVAKLNVISHQKGRKHKAKCDEWVAYYSKLVQALEKKNIAQHASVKPEKNVDYYCPSCNTSVAKLHVISHENGRKHKAKCDEWVAHFSKPVQAVEKKNIAQRPSVVSVESSSSISSTEILNEDPALNNIHKSNGLSKKFQSNVSNLSGVSRNLSSKTIIQSKLRNEAEVNTVCGEEAREKEHHTSPRDISLCENEDKPFKTGMNYYCSLCAVSVPTANVNTHVNGQKHRKKCERFNQGTSVADKCSTEAGKVTDEKVQQIVEDYLSLQEPFVYWEQSPDGFYVCAKCKLKLRFDVMLTHVLGRRHLKSVGALDWSAYDQKLNLLFKLGSYRTQNLKILKVITPDVVNNFIKAASCLLKVFNGELISNHSSNSRLDNALKQNIDSSCVVPGENFCGPDHDWLDGLGQLKRTFGQNFHPAEVVCSQPSSSLLHLSEDTEQSSKLNHKIGSLSSVVASSILHSTSIVNSTSSGSENFSKNERNNQDDNPQAKTDDADLVSLFETLVIGDKSGSSLLEEFHLACPGGNISDYEIECGICGLAFQIYNVNGEEDVDFSFDMHVQNDPQHVLATDVPTERNPQSMSESARTSSSASLLKTSRGLSRSSQVPKPVIFHPKGRSNVIKVLFSLDQRNIVVQQGSYYCKLCKIAKNTDSQFAAHLLSKTHICPRWLKILTDIELNHWLQELSFLLKAKSVYYPLRLAFDRINNLMIHHNRACPSSSSMSVETSSILGKSVVDIDISAKNTDAISNSSLTDKWCSYCYLNLSSRSKVSRKRHRQTCRKLNQTSVITKPSLQVSTHKQHFCKVCSRWMLHHTKASHESGKSHRNCVKGLSSGF